jgi:hypothetical protein
VQWQNASSKSEFVNDCMSSQLLLSKVKCIGIQRLYETMRIIIHCKERDMKVLINEYDTTVGIQFIPVHESL